MRPTYDQIKSAIEAAGGNQTLAAREMGISRGMLQRVLAKPAPEFYQEPSTVAAEESIEDLVDRRKRVYEQRHEAAKADALQVVRVKIPGPIGIIHMGDPHVDDDGCDLGAVEAHTRIARETPGMFAANIGDTTNNWVGRLARLYSEQSTTAHEAWRLAEWLFEQCPWLYVTGGNHDSWSGAGDPLKWIAKSVGTKYSPSQARLSLQFPSGREVRINARHDFRGNSQWNAAHGQMKAAQLGYRDHILVSGHKHISGYGIVKCPSTGILSHCIQIASYKVHDRYATELGLRDQHISPCGVTIIDPAAKAETGLVQFFWDPEAAADYLTFLRSRAKLDT